MRATAAIAIAILLATPAVVESALLDISFEPAEFELGIDLGAPADSLGSLPFEMLVASDLETAGSIDAGADWVPEQTVMLATAPEPTTALLLGLGLVGLAWAGRPRTQLI